MKNIDIARTVVQKRRNEIVTALATTADAKDRSWLEKLFAVRPMALPVHRVVSPLTREFAKIEGQFSRRVVIGTHAYIHTLFAEDALFDHDAGRYALHLAGSYEETSDQGEKFIFKCSTTREMDTLTGAMAEIVGGLTSHGIEATPELVLDGLSMRCGYTLADGGEITGVGGRGDQITWFPATGDEKETPYNSFLNRLARIKKSLK